MIVNHCVYCIGIELLINKSVVIMNCLHCTFSGNVFPYSQQPFAEAIVYVCSSPSCGRLSYACNAKCRNACNSIDTKKSCNIKAFKTQDKLVLHLKNMHSLLSSQVSTQDVDALTTFDMPCNNVMHTDFNIKVGDNVLSVSMTWFVTWCCQLSTQHATRQLLCLAAFQKTEHTKLVGNVHVDSLHIFLYIAQLLVSCTMNNQMNLSNLLRRIWQFFPHSNTSWMPIPITLQQFQSHVLNRNNQYALMSIIPIPKAKLLSDNVHTFCPLVEVLGYAVFFSKPTGYKLVEPKHQQLVNSPYVQQFIAQAREGQSNSFENVLCLSLFWMDGYDPNRSTKGNRKGAWAGTQTFILANLQGQQVYYVDSLLFASGPGKGSKKEDHSIVLQAMVNDKLLCYHPNGSPKPLALRSMYHNKNVVHFYVLTICGLMDNPERRGNYGLMQGNSKLHGYFGISCCFAKLDRSFAACKHCSALVQDRIKKKIGLSYLIIATVLIVTDGLLQKF